MPTKEAHFATFPRDLIERPIRATTPEGGTVFDPFMGSGTVALVAESLGIKWRGTEINANYCQIAAARLTRQIREAA